MCHGAEHAALHGHHLERGEVVAVIGGAGAVLEQEALEAAVVRLAHRGVHAHVGRDAREDQMGDPLVAQHELEVGQIGRAHV